VFQSLVVFVNKCDDNELLKVQLLLKVSQASSQTRHYIENYPEFRALKTCLQLEYQRNLDLQRALYNFKRAISDEDVETVGFHPLVNTPLSAISRQLVITYEHRCGDTFNIIIDRQYHAGDEYSKRGDISVLMDIPLEQTVPFILNGSSIPPRNANGNRNSNSNDTRMFPAYLHYRDREDFFTRAMPGLSSFHNNNDWLPTRVMSMEATYVLEEAGWEAVEGDEEEVVVWELTVPRPSKPVACDGMSVARRTVQTVLSMCQDAIDNGGDADVYDEEELVDLPVHMIMIKLRRDAVFKSLFVRFATHTHTRTHHQ
jgi:hypothetical protein